MDDLKKLEHAKEVYTTLCSALDDRNWKYEKDEDKLLVHFSVSGDDLPMRFVMVVDADRQLVRLLSQLPVVFGEDKRMDGAIACCAVTNKLANGSFDYDFATGKVVFRMTQTIRGSSIGPELLNYMVNCSAVTVDNYNDKLFAISKGFLDVTDFLAGK